MKPGAFRYYYAPTGVTGVAGISSKPTPEILKLQAEIIVTAKSDDQGEDLLKREIATLDLLTSGTCRRMVQ